MSGIDAHRALKTAIKNRDFAPVYYLHGEDDYLKGEQVRELVDAAVDPSTRDFNLEILDGGDLEAETLGSHLSTPPMMSERRVVVVRDVNALKKDARAMLDRYLARPASDLLLVLTTSGAQKADRKLLASTMSIEFAPLSGHRVPRWIAYYVDHDLGGTITPEAVELLQQAVGTDLAQLKVELDKLASFAGTGVIDEAAVSAVVGVRPGETMGSLFDAVALRDATRARALLPAVLQQPKSSAVQIIMALAVQTLAIGWAAAARQRSATNPRRLESELYALLKESGSVFVGRPWGEAVRTWVGAVEHWTPADADAALEALFQADAALKETRLSSDEQLLANVVFTMCGINVPRRAA